MLGVTKTSLHFSRPTKLKELCVRAQVIIYIYIHICTHVYITRDMRMCICINVCTYAVLRLQAQGRHRVGGCLKCRACSQRKPGSEVPSGGTMTPAEGRWMSGRSSEAKHPMSGRKLWRRRKSEVFGLPIQC